MGLTLKVGLLIILIIIIASLGLLFWLRPTKTLPKLDLAEQAEVPTVEYQTNAKTTIKVSSADVATFVKMETLKLHLPPPLSTPPKLATSSASFVFKAEVISPQGEVIYSSWKSFPTKRDADNSFTVTILTPYQKQAVLRLKNTQDKVILIRKL